MRLSDIAIKALKAPKKGAAIYYDDLLTGFGVRVSEGGTKSFILTHGVRRQRETIGRVGIVSLREARSEAKRRLAEYTLGKTKASSPTWTVAVEEFLAEIERTRRARTHQSYVRVLHKHFRFGEMKIADIASADFTKKLAKLSHAPSEQHHTFIAVHTFIRWAHRNYYLDVDPLSRMRSSYRYHPRTRVLSDTELAKVWHAAGSMGIYGDMVRLLILTGQRGGEISRLRAGMVGRDAIILPAWLAKNGREHRFPMGLLAVAILQKYAGDTDGEALLFPARGKSGNSFSGFSKSKQKLDELSGVGDWTLHDLRRTFATGLAALAVPLPAVERLLNHVSGSFAGIVAVYQRYDFMREMREAIAKWDRHILEITEGGSTSRATLAVSDIPPAFHFPKLSSEIACEPIVPGM
ncbi:MAG TPA: tyrosine-type recombinase/integrase [Rhizomicrobium sp.]|jgi:integrase